jgi:hypothetical protein
MSKILYVASTIGHINNFHLPYIERLRAEGHTVSVMANGEGADHNIPFEKRVLSLRNLFLKGKIRKIIYTGGYDTVILNTTLAAFHVRRALKKNNRPKVINIVHGYLFSEHTPRFRSSIYLGCERKMAKENKAEFVQKLGDFYRTEVNEDFGIIGLSYIKTIYDEYVMVQFQSGSRKKFCVTGDSHQGILFDFIKFLTYFNEYDWEI